MSPTAPPLMQNGVNLIMESNLNLHKKEIMDMIFIAKWGQLDYGVEFEFAQKQIMDMILNAHNSSYIILFCTQSNMPISYRYNLTFDHAQIILNMYSKH